MLPAGRRPQSGPGDIIIARMYQHVKGFLIRGRRISAARQGRPAAPGMEEARGPEGPPPPCGRGQGRGGPGRHEMGAAAHGEAQGPPPPQGARRGPEGDARPTGRGPQRPGWQGRPDAGPAPAAAGAHGGLPQPGRRAGTPRNRQGARRGRSRGRHGRGPDRHRRSRSPGPNPGGRRLCGAAEGGREPGRAWGPAYRRSPDRRDGQRGRVGAEGKASRPPWRATRAPPGPGPGTCRSSTPGCGAAAPQSERSEQGRRSRTRAARRAGPLLDKRTLFHQLNP